MSTPEGFEEYVAARLPALSRTAYLLTGHHQDAEDLVQRALVKVVAVWPRIADHPDPYVKRVMYHENVSRWRRRSRRPEQLTGTVPERATHDRADTDTRLALEEALRRLTPKQRTVLVLRYYEDLTEVQTAEAMGVALGTVKSQTRHALMRLRELAPGLESLLVS
jgi:RNA polymerase sigma-70 factor (sigma-E family)